MRIFSGIQPTGRKHLGNYIGAIRQGSAFLDRPGYDEGPAHSSRICGREQADLDVAARVVQLADIAWYDGRDGHAFLDPEAYAKLDVTQASLQVRSLRGGGFA